MSRTRRWWATLTRGFGYLTLDPSPNLRRLRTSHPIQIPVTLPTGQNAADLTRQLAATLRAFNAAGPSPREHTWPHYWSTYCIHQLHQQCRLTCKTCDAPCRCPCHGADIEEPTSPDRGQFAGVTAMETG